MPFQMHQKVGLGYILALMVGTTMADPFKSMNESFGKIETGYGFNDAEFMKYRTQYHFSAPVNWMNDPSAPYFDGQYYHLYYQHNPYDAIWGNMTWGHAISTDLLKWQDRPFALYPDGPDDQLGAFDGTVLFEKGYQDLPTLVYTAVSASGKSYIQGQEKQVLAVTKDNGDTWTRIKTVIAEPPHNMTVNGFRDPYLFCSSAFDKLLKLDTDDSASDSIYMTVSSGIDGKGGRLWLYHSRNWLDWEFRGPLLSHPDQHVANPIYYGNDGGNWEVASYYPLADPLGGDDWHVVSWGSQWGRQKKNFDHWALWTAGQQLVVSEPDQNDEVRLATPRIEETMSGVFDWGILYAQLMFRDTKNGNKNRGLVVGWVQDDLLLPEKNPGRWNGVMGLIRETFIQKIDNVSPQDPLLKQGYSSWLYDEKSKTVRTLGTRPMAEVATMRGNKQWTLLGQSNNKDLSNYTIPINSKYVEIDATFHVSSESTFDIVVRQSLHEETVISYIPSNGNIYINRTLSTQQPDLYRTDPESHAVPLFQILQQDGDDHTKIEPLDLRIFVDNSLVEVFANERMAVSTRIYPTRDDSIGMSLRVPDDVTVTKFDVYSIDFTAWDRP